MLLPPTVMSDLYPANPPAVPEGLTAASAAYKRNAWLAMGGLMSFVVLYVGLTGWFSYKAVTLLRYGFQTGSGWALAAGCVAAFLAVFLGKALLFIRHHRDESAIEVTAAEEPELFAFVYRIADDVGAPRPHRVYLSPRVNAAVSYDLSLMNLLIPSRKNLELGLGLVNVLSLSELKAVLAHEFGHFAQRSMAVGRWVYISQQIAARIVGNRDILDRFLLLASGIDPRLAWIGWSLRILVWSIRSVMDSFFRVVILAERALSREMELQADRVAVSLSGSDALIHALHKSAAADDAWDKAANVVIESLGQKQRVPDLLSLQSRVIEHMRRILGPEAGYGVVPELPAEHRDQHRLFTSGLAEPPAMWSTHPANHVREENAKARYVPAPSDDRSGWLVFADPPRVRRQITEQLIVQACADRGVLSLAYGNELEPITDDAALDKVDARLGKAYLDPCYRGLYLGRTVTRSTGVGTQLYSEIPRGADALRAALTDLYPESLADEVRDAREVERERAQLEAIQDGILTAPGGVIQYRGQPIRRRELPGLLHRVRHECTSKRQVLDRRDRTVRSASWAAASQLGRGWPGYLEGLLALLHYAEHSEANVDDAMAHLSNVMEIVMADGHVSDAERRRVVAAANDVHWTLYQLWEQRAWVRMSPDVAERFKVATWADAIGESFELPQASEENIGEFMRVIAGWHRSSSIALADLRFAALETLLMAEAHVAQCHLDGIDPGDAPERGMSPPNYSVLLKGEERQQQRTLGWWDRFAVAEGVGPGLMRLAVAGSIVGLVVGFGGTIGSATAYVYNGLGQNVVVRIDGTEQTLLPNARAEFEVEAKELVHIHTTTESGEEIESFDGEISVPMGNYVYNVAGAAWLERSYMAYTKTDADELRPPQTLGAARWLLAKEDYLFEDPPEPVFTRRGETETRTVLSAIQDMSPLFSASVEDEAERHQMIMAHARWDPVKYGGAGWLEVAATEDGFADLLQQRLTVEGDSVVLGRLEQDTTKNAAHDAVCKRHQSRAETQPDSADFQYLAVRCLEDDEERNEAVTALRGRFPKNPWIAMAAGHVHFERDELSESVSAFAEARSTLLKQAHYLPALEARVRRLEAPADEPPQLDELAKTSVVLSVLHEIERGELNGTYVKLGTGDLAAAIAAAKSSVHRNRVLRLAAASDGASEEIVIRARTLPPTAGIDADTAGVALVMALRHGDDPTPYREAMERLFGEHAEDLLAFANAESLRADLSAANKRLMAMQPSIRGHAATLGVLALQHDAPPIWRKYSQRLLFASERPWLPERLSNEETSAEPDGTLARAQ